MKACLIVALMLNCIFLAAWIWSVTDGKIAAKKARIALNSLQDYCKFLEMVGRESYLTIFRFMTKQPKDFQGWKRFEKLTEDFVARSGYLEFEIIAREIHSTLPFGEAGNVFLRAIHLLDSEGLACLMYRDIEYNLDGRETETKKLIFSVLEQLRVDKMSFINQLSDHIQNTYFTLPYSTECQNSAMCELQKVKEKLNV
jgi:hypothetical protein